MFPQGKMRFICGFYMLFGCMFVGFSRSNAKFSIHQFSDSLAHFIDQGIGMSKKSFRGWTTAWWACVLCLFSHQFFLECFLFEWLMLLCQAKAIALYFSNSGRLCPFLHETVQNCNTCVQYWSRHRYLPHLTWLF